jgi:ubiquinone/menaquinone biosynthesis C-methylase UbiE
MNCDRIARWYLLLEYASFGAALQRRRCHFLPSLRERANVLMLGEGDGRFLAKFLAANPSAEIDYVDGSAKMLRLARTRAGSTTRVCFRQLDIVRDQLPKEGYDCIITHFFLDCFTAEELALVVQKIAAAAGENVCWIISEFREPASGWRRLRARLWIRFLYFAFRIATNLRTERLPDHATMLRSAGFTLEAESFASAGLLTSQRWIKSKSGEQE